MEYFYILLLGYVFVAWLSCYLQEEDDRTPSGALLSLIAALLWPVALLVSAMFPCEEPVRQRTEGEDQRGRYMSRQ